MNLPPWDNPPEVLPDENLPEVVPESSLESDGNLSHPEEALKRIETKLSIRSGGVDKPFYDDEKSSNKKLDRICGLHRRVFHIILGVTVIVVIAAAAAVGGWVGGTRRAQENTSTDTANRANPNISSSSPSSTSLLPTPTVSSLGNQRNLAFQGFSESNYKGGATAIFRDEGFHDLGLNARSYVWLQNNTNCCVTLCANETAAIGWWCSQRYNPESSNPISRVSIWCGGAESGGIKKESCS